jgi:uncharacterized protein
MVIESHPRLDDGSPFPTLFYLTCPMLVKRVSRLEGGGEMASLNDELARDADLRVRLQDAVARYALRRDEHEWIDTGAPPGGGSERVKCLHAHVAHELADPPNPAGARALAMTGWPDCVAPCVPAVTGADQ